MSKKYQEIDILIKDLQNNNTAAIEYLINQTEAYCNPIFIKYGINKNSFPEIIHDGVLIFLQKLKDFSYDPSKSSPITFVVSICSKLASNHSRYERIRTTQTLIETNHEISDNLNPYFELFEYNKVLFRMLNELGEKCKKLIWLKYIDGFSDDDQIKSKLTDFTTINSLKVTRNQCMRKLSEISKKYKIHYNE